MDRFIESLLLGYPVPGIFLVEEPKRRLLVLDGQQRLRTLLAFYRNSYRDNPYRLENLEDELKGLTYETLSVEQRRTLDNTFIHATVVRHDPSHKGYRAVYQLFERLNTGGTNLQPQEIRVALFHGPYVQLLRELNDLQAWRSLYGVRSQRLKDQELILRVLAFIHRRDEYKRPLKVFLNDFLEAFQDASTDQCDQDRQLFTATCSAVLDSIGPRAFRHRRNLNAALLDAVMVGVASRLQRGSIAAPDELEAAYESLMSNEDFLGAITAATADEESVILRLDTAVSSFSGVR